MKTYSTFRLLLLGWGLAATGTAASQPSPSEGYWNLETNLTTRDHTIVRFYDQHNQLVYEERLNNLCLDLSKGNGLCRRTARQLNVALKQVLHTPANVPPTTFLATYFKQNRRVQRVYAVR